MGCTSSRSVAIILQEVAVSFARMVKAVTWVLFASFPASDHLESKRFYEEAVGLLVVREFDGLPHRFTDLVLGGMVLKV